MEVLISLSILFLWFYCSILLHELSHAIMGYVVGFPPYQVIIGSGKRLFSCTFFNVAFHIHAIPFSGLTQSRRIPRQGLWWRGALFNAAGIMAELCLLVFLCTVYIHYEFRIVPLLIIFQFFSILENSLPHSKFINNIQLPNDGLKTWEFLSGKISQQLAEDVAKYHSEIARYDSPAKLQEPWFLNIDQELVSLYHEASQDLSQTRYDDAIDKFLALLESDAMQVADRARILDAIASIAIVKGKNQYLDVAHDCSEQAFQLLPQAKTVQGTYACVLIEKGDLDEGIAILMKLTTEDNDPVDRSIACCYLAKAYYMKQQMTRYRYWLEYGKKIGACQGVCQRIEGETQQEKSTPAYLSPQANQATLEKEAGNSRTVSRK